MHRCVNGTIMISNAGTDMPCPAQFPPRYTFQMMHVWSVPGYPGGPFSDDLSPASVKAGVQRALSQG